MIQILEYIAQNYTLFLSVLVLILLAIIGYYADKTNFGQGKNQEKKPKDKITEIKTLNDEIKTDDSFEEEKVIENVEPIYINEEKQENTNKNAVMNDLKKEQTENVVNDNKEEQIENIVNDNVNDNKEEQTENIVNDNKEEQIENDVNSIKVEEQIIKKEEQIKEFDEIESLLPKKELINNDLLDEIEGMEFKSIKEKSSFSVPDLDNIRLPKIKNLVEKEQDIWKF